MNREMLGDLLSGKGSKAGAMSDAYQEVLAEKKAKRKEDAKKMLTELADLYEAQLANRKKFKEADDKLTKQIESGVKRVLAYEAGPQEKTEEETKPEETPAS